MASAWDALIRQRDIDYSRWQIVVWWEYRRIVYNLFVGALGVITIMVVEALGGHFVKPGEDVIEPMALFVIVPLFALVANACYTFGWIVDLVNGRTKPNTRLLLVGCAFSTVVTLIPAMFFCTLALVRLVRH